MGPSCEDTLGRIKGIQSLALEISYSNSRDIHPFQAVADAVNYDHSLRHLEVGLGNESYLRDSSGLTALSSAIRKHAGLQEFSLVDQRPLTEAAQSTVFDPLLRTLSTCRHF
jgi:hypothetical protein